MYKKIFSIVFLFVFSFSFISSPSLVLADDNEEVLEDSAELVLAVDSEEEEELSLDDFTEEELLEAEPSDIPEAEEDPVLTKRLFGRMLLDVEGNGEVYYLDPVTGGKEYLADGSSAHFLLERRALGINEEDFARLTLGTDRDEESVCDESELGEALKGRIVIRVDENGEAYWILPTNCRAYYVGTHDAAYELMKKFSLGLTKANLAKIANNKRQRAKRAYRHMVYAYAEDNDMTLAEARADLSDEVKAMRECMQTAREALEEKPGPKERRDQVMACLENSGLPRIDKERREEIKQSIHEARMSRIKNKGLGLGDIDLKNIFQRAKKAIRDRRAILNNQ